MVAGRHRLPAPPRGLRAMAGRLSWGLADQAASSLTNFAVGIYVARELGAVAFGVFSIAWVTYGVLINVSRGLATDPLMVRFSGVATESWRGAVARSAGTALAVGVASGVLSLLLGLAIGGSVGAAFVALGVILPALLLQDAWRFAFFASGEGRRALANDLVWAGALVPAMVLAAGQGSVVAFLLAWGGSAAVAAAYGCVQTRLVPRLTAVRAWLVEQRDLGTRYLVENVSNSGGSQLRMYGLGAIAGLADVGAVRGAELLLGPFLAVLMGLASVGVAEAARVLRRDARKLPWFCAALGGGQAAGVLLWGLALLVLLPDSVGRLVLGDVWAPASALIVPLTLSVTNASFITGAAAGLRALGASRRSMRCQLIASAAYVAGGLSGAAISGAEGSAWGVAAATLFAAVVWWAQFRAAQRDVPAPEGTSTPTGEARQAA